MYGMDFFISSYNLVGWSVWGAGETAYRPLHDYFIIIEGNLETNFKSNPHFTNDEDEIH